MSLVGRPVGPVVSGGYSPSTTDAAHGSVETATRATVLIRSGADTAHATEAVVSSAGQARTGTDATTVSDANTRASILARTASDAANGGTDSNTDFKGQIGIATDVAHADDGTSAFGHIYFLARSGADPPTLTGDAAVMVLLRIRTGAENAHGTDAAVGASLHSRQDTGLEVAHATDAAVRSMVYVGHSATDTAHGTDAATRVTVYNRSASDAVTGSDVLTTPSRQFGRTGTDSANSVSGALGNRIDTPTSVATHFRATSDAGYLLDTQTEQWASPRRSLSQPLSHPVFALRIFNALLDSVVSVVNHPRTATGDSAPATDNAVRSAIVRQVPVFDYGTASDGGARRVFVGTRAVIDDATVSDSATGLRIVFATQNLSAVGYSNAIKISTPGATRLVPETVRGSDVVDTGHSKVRAATDQAYLTTPAHDAATSTVYPQRIVVFGPTGYSNVIRIGLQQWRRNPSDAANGGTDVAVGQKNYFRSTAETAHAVDTYTSQRVYFRSTADAAGGTDVLTQQTTHIQSVADTAHATDAASRAIVLARSATDSVPVTDAISRTLNLARNTGFTDSLVTTDVASPVSNHIRSVSETTTLSETAVRSNYLGTRTGADTAHATDNSAGVIGRLRTGLETIPTADDGLFVPRNIIIVRPTGPDSAPAVDSPSKFQVNARFTTDGVATIFEVVTASMVLSRNSADTAPASDVLSQLNQHLRTDLLDSYPTTDAATRVAPKFRTATDKSVEALVDNITRFQDNAVRVVLFERDTTESVTGIDTLSPRFLFLTRHVVEAVDGTDTPSRSQVIARTADEDISLNAGVFEIATRALILVRLLADVAHATDAPTSFASALRTTADTAHASDSPATWVLLNHRFAFDFVTGQDSTSGGHIYSLSASDNYPIQSESVTTFTHFFHTGTDHAFVSEALVSFVAPHRLGADSAPAVDSPATWSKAAKVRTAHDEAAAADIAIGLRGAVLMVTDSAGGTDAVVSFSTRSRITVDVLHTSDIFGRFVRMVRLPTDSAPAHDVLTGGRLHFEVITDSAPATDVATRILGRFFRSWAESIGGRDSGEGHRQFYGLATDIAHASDAAFEHRLLLRVTTDSIAGLTDLVIGQRRLLRLPHEHIHLLEAAVVAQLLRRTPHDVVHGVDVAAASRLRVRFSFDAALATDIAVRTRVRARTGLDAAPATDHPTRLLRAARGLTERLHTLDLLTRKVTTPRLTSDVAHAVDHPTSHALHLRSISEVTSIHDSLGRVAGIRRKVIDTALAREAVARHFVGHRTPADAAGGFAVLSYRRHYVRALVETYPTHDVAYHHLTVLKPFGPPKVFITSVSRYKVSGVPTYDSALVTFGFDRPVVAWTVRVGSTGAFDGLDVGHYFGARNAGFGRAPFGTSAFGRAIASTITGSVTVTDDDLWIGENNVAIYGRSPSGEWSSFDSGPAYEEVSP